MRTTIPLFLTLLLGVQDLSSAGLIFFTSESDWLAAVSGVETLVTDSAGVATANEVPSAPGNNTSLGSLLTFDASNTGLSRSFELESLDQPNFVFNVPSLPSVDSLSIGPFSTDDNDDWQVTITGGPSTTAFAFDLISNNSTVGESFSIYGEGDVLLGTLDAVDIPSHPTDGEIVQFLGVVSDSSITRVAFDDDDDQDDNIAVADFRFADANPTVPEPTSLLLFSVGAIGLAATRYRRQS